VIGIAHAHRNVCSLLMKWQLDCLTLIKKRFDNLSDSVVRICLGTGWTVPVANPGRGKRFFSSINCPDRLWGPRRLLFNGYLSYFFRGKAAGA
jgi:hypothetical protein